MTKRIVGWLVLLPFCILLVLFALANRHTVKIGFDPLGSQPPLLPSIDVPVFIIFFFFLILGVLLGGVSTWISQGSQRRQKRHWRNKAKHMQAEIEEAHNQEIEEAHRTQNLLEKS